MASRPDLGTMDTEKLKEVLAKVDEWIHKRRPRWMDLIGDYAGDEFFIVDGDSLCQVVLEDELVAIGGDKPTFQILHAIYRLEQEIQQLKQRNSNKHGTILTGANKFTTASRYLAREILKAHISQLSKVGIHSANFKDLKDAEWHNYVSIKQPMFVILHAGPPLDDIVDSIDKVALSRTLLQEHFFGTCSLHGSLSPRSIKSNSIKAMLAESKNPLDAQFAFLFFASQMALGSMSMQQRAVELCVIDQELSDYLKAEFYPAIFRHLGTRLLKAEFFPDLDGNLFMVLLNCVLKSPNVALGALVGEGLAQDVSSAWTSAGLSIPNLGELLSQYAFTEPKPVKTAPAPRYELLPFSHPIFDEYLPSITTISETSRPKIFMRTRVEALCDEPFMDEKHWHNDKSILPKHLGDRRPSSPYRLGKDEKVEKGATVYGKLLQRHAQTMVGAKGQPIKRIVISEATTSLGASGSRHEQRPKDPAPRPLEHKADKPGKGAKAKAPQLNSAQKLKAKIEAEKQVKKATEDETWWKSQLKEISAMEDLEEQFRRVDLILQGKRAESGWLSVEVLLYRINLVIESWNAHERKEDESVCEDYTVRILQAIDQFRENRNLFPAAANILSQIMEVLGFGSFTPRNQQVKTIAYGTFMDRSMDSAPDPRVGFEPDGWQRKVLDRIDRSESTLVVAPTSAGKTFSSFYAMEKVLRESNDGIIVYVSPTKALCQQIAADVYARFSKNMKGKTIWAIHTRDFRVNDPLRTQILVTVPDILSIMLLSPSLSRIWVPRIKFIILDEIHSIGQLEGGQVWEHILLLSTCPILGLSATVGQPEAFSEWLGSVQKEHNQGYAMIEHKYRYSHLRKYIWEMPKPGSLPSFNGLKSPDLEDSRLRVLHPMSALLLGGGTMPPDLALESQDCLSLYSMMTKCVSRGELQHLDPHVFFKAKDTSFLAQIDVIRYEEALKEIIEEWMNAKDARAPDSSYQKLLRELEDNMSRSGSIGDLEDAHPHSTAVNGFIHLLHKLNSNGDLPCLAFCFDRSGCEDFAKGLTISLIRAERTWRASNRQWLQKMEQWEAWKATFKLRQREADRASRQKKDDPQTEDFRLQIPSPAIRRRIYKRMLLFKSGNETLAGVFDLALRRGIAVHHAGMPKGYRVLVESRLPPLTGNWPLTTTLCLRLFNLLTGSDEAPAAVTAIDSFMRLPRLSLSSDQTRNEVLHHMRFSIEYLRRLRLLSNDGHVTALFGAVGHLYYEEPGNLVFASLVRSGVIHRMCSQYKFNKVETERNIIHLVATLVARLPLPYFSSSQEVLKRLRSTLPSLIQLPPLPSYIQNAFQQYNEETLRIFSTYAVTYAHHLKSQPDSALPLSLHEVVSRVQIVSLNSLRPALSHNVPYFEYDAPVNAYALDYWQHESVHPLIEANGLRAGEVWFVLQNFSLALTTILTSLRALLIDRTTRKNSEPEPETKPVGQPRSKSNNWDDSETSEDEQDHKKTQKASVEKEEINDEGDDQEGALAEGELLGQLEITDRPDGVEEEDWLVYSAFQSVSTQFYEKWRKMWA
ncbi:P-loop containing nucleoside triphosphate hydrolase protein [Rhizoctonia solani]|uniref:P-loop containing nucleoside triphosphate hydrolase protein n=1 Tax=Rhizoctonia solani TaxID=456999 RepID=A0A8H7I246_9AGAM|nr:P-loop containing nucleoside triphosphate hydrolase protein [Rhizoctonia solani]